MKNKALIIVSLIVLAIFIGLILVNQQGNKKTSISEGSKELIPINEITHGHGLAVDVTDPTIIYIATHHGLLKLENEKDLYQVGSAKDDYMGFSPHPSDAKVFFSSGHPSRGGNIGFQKSEDGGFTWKKIANGIDGPVDFHAMTVSPANPNLIYRWYQGAIQRSLDGGKSWEITSTTSAPIVSLIADPKDENIVYSASPQGLMISKNKGKDWSKLLDGFVSAVAINPHDPQEILSFSEKNGLARSTDSGKNWEKITTDFGGETPLFISFNKQQPEIVYLLTEKNSIYKSLDGGNAWSKIK